MKNFPKLGLLFVLLLLAVGYVYLFHWDEGKKQADMGAVEPERQEDGVITKHGFVDVLAMASKKMQQKETYHPMIDPYIDEPRKRVEMDPFDEYVVKVFDEYFRVPMSTPESIPSFDLRVNGKWPVYKISIEELKSQSELFDLEAWAMNPQRITKDDEAVRSNFLVYLMKLQGLERCSASTIFVGGFGSKIVADRNPYYETSYYLRADATPKDHKRFMTGFLYEMILIDRFIQHPDYTLRMGAYYRTFFLMKKVARNKFLTQGQRAALTYALGEWIVVPKLWNARPQRMYGPHKDDILISLTGAYTKAGILFEKFFMYYRDDIIRERLRKDMFRRANLHRLVGAEYLLNVNKPEEAESYMESYEIKYEYDKDRRLDVMAAIKKQKQLKKNH